MKTFTLWCRVHDSKTKMAVEMGQIASVYWLAEGRPTLALRSFSRRGYTHIASIFLVVNVTFDLLWESYAIVEKVAAPTHLGYAHHVLHNKITGPLFTPPPIPHYTPPPPTVQVLSPTVLRHSFASVPCRGVLTWPLTFWPTSRGDFVSCTFFWPDVNPFGVLLMAPSNYSFF